MESFEDRQKGFEAAFQRDQELAFRITARRNRLFGLWAAERLGLPAGDAAERYAQTVVAQDFEARATMMLSERCAAISPRRASL